MECLCLYARSLSNKTSELQTFVSDIDPLAVSETLLKPKVENCEFLHGNDYTIHGKDKIDRTGGGILLNTTLSVRRNVLESNAQMRVCKIHPESKKRILLTVSTDHPTRT